MMNSGAMETGGEIEKDIANTIISADKVIIPFGSNRSNQKLLGHAKRRISRRKPESYHVLRNFEVVGNTKRRSVNLPIAGFKIRSDSTVGFNCRNEGREVKNIRSITRV